MTRWEAVRQHMLFIENPPDDRLAVARPQYAKLCNIGPNILDDFANLIKGINDCTSVYIQNDGSLKISANCSASDQNNVNNIVTRYEGECMLQYAEKFYDGTDLTEILQKDKRFVDSHPKLNIVNNKIQTIITQLTTNQTSSNYQEEDDFSSLDEDNDNAPILVIDPIAENLKTKQGDFDNYLKTQSSGTETPQQILDNIDQFIGDVNALLVQIAQNDNEINNAIKVIEAKLPLVKDEDFRFVIVLNKLRNDGYNSAHELGFKNKLLDALNSNLEYVFKIGQNQLYENIITDIPYDNQYHTEHRMAVDIEQNNKRSVEDDYDYIGISRTCCAICHYVVHYYYDHQVQGTHGKYCNGDALIGLSLHSSDVQKEILDGLFPNLTSDDEEIFEETTTENNYLSGTDATDSLEEFVFNENDFPSTSDNMEVSG